jgi:hypothetical protein
MKTIENKTMEFDVIKYEQDGAMMKFVSKAKTNTFESLLQVIKQPDPQNGLGDLEEQHLRMKLLSKVKVAMEKEDPSIEVEDADGKFLAKNIKHIKYVILDEGLIEFQEMVQALGK